MAKLAAYALVFAFLSLLLLNSGFADITAEDAKQNIGDTAQAAGQAAGDAMNKAASTAQEAGRKAASTAQEAGSKAASTAQEAGNSWSNWFSDIINGNKDAQDNAPTPGPAV